MSRRYLPVLALAGLLAAGCAGPAIYVPATDPALQVCQSPQVQNISSLQTDVDNANNTNHSLMNVPGTELRASMIRNLQKTAGIYRLQAGEVPAHPDLATALRGAAQEFSLAASSPTGLTTNSVAIAANKFSGEVQGICASLQVGSPARAGKPGPGIWNWGLFWVVTIGYMVMSLVASILIAMAERNKPRRKRRSPEKIFWLSLVWWVTIFAALGGTYKHAIASMTLTRDEKKDDRLAALAKENARLEAGLRRPLP